MKVKLNGKLDENLYYSFIKKTANKEGWKVADIANKLALEKKAISTDLYLKAARYIVKVRLAK